MVGQIIGANSIRQAIWPATNMSGERVSTGVYLIFASDDTGEFKCNTKVMVVR